MSGSIQAKEVKARNMKRFILMLLSVALLTISGHAADAVYHNIGTVGCADPPQVDATVFVNDGSFCAGHSFDLPGFLILFPQNTAIPYTTQNTLSFTNNGLMQSDSGFQLDY